MTWKDLLQNETKRSYYRSMLRSIKSIREREQVYPPEEEVFNAFRLCSLEDLQVVIIGQDPYHGPGQAHGLAFSVNKGITIPPSLKNIFKEIKSDISSDFSPEHGNLTGWARQGVLLLNTYLTVEKGKPLSHSKIGWERFTKKVITKIDEYHGSNCVFLLWGSHARSMGPFIENGKIFASPHPSPLATGFAGCGHFSKANDYLLSKGRQGVDWCIL